MTNPTSIRTEFITESKIAPNLFEKAVTFLPDLEINHVTHEVEGTPLYDALGWPYTRFGHQAKPNLLGAAFIQETGEPWQCKIYGELNKPRQDKETRGQGGQGDKEDKKDFCGEQSPVSPVSPVSPPSEKRTGQYYAPKGIGDVPYLPPVPREFIEKLALEYDLPLPPENTSFWQWFQENKVIPLLLTEGGKKSLSALSSDIVAIALYGCLCGVDSETGAVKESLRPYIEGRRVYIAFDQDKKPKTRQTVAKATQKLALAITKASGEPYQVLWNTEDGKGVDDVIKNQGGDYFKHRIKLAQLIDPIQQQLNTLTRDIDLTVNQANLEGILKHLPRTGKLHISSPKCTRKSSAIIEPLVKEWKQKKQLVISIVPRILLGKEQAVRWDINWIDEYGKAHFESYDTIGLCFDSLGKLSSKNWSGALILFDEIRQGFKHFISSPTLEERRSFLLKLLQEKLPQAVNGGGLIVGCDSDLTDVEINYIDEICPVGKTFIVKNEYQPKKGLVIFNTGKYDETLDEILHRYENGENLFIFCDTKANSQAIHDRLKQLDPHATHWLLNGDTTSEAENKAIIENNINDSLKQQKPRSLVFTTSMSTGISIDGWINHQFHAEVFDHFTYGFVIAQGGILEPVEITQSMARVRKNLDFTVYSGTGKKPDDLLNSCHPDVIKRQIYKRNHRAFDLQLITAEILEEKLGREPTHYEILAEMMSKCDPETGMVIDPHLDLYCRAKARLNYASQNFDLMLYQQLIDEGYQLARYDCLETTSTGNQIREIKEAHKWEEAEATADSLDICIEEAIEISYSNAPVEQRRQAAKAFLKQELPGVELTPDFIYKAVIKDKRRWLRGHKLFWYCQHPDITREIDLGHYLNKIKQFANGVIFLPDLRNVSVMVDEINELGLWELIDLENPRELSKDDPRVLSFMERAYFRRYKLYNALGLTVTEKTDSIKFIERLLQRLGLGLVLTRTEKQGEKKIRYYSLNTEALNDPDRVAVLEALTRRFLGAVPTNYQLAEKLPPSVIESGTGLSQEYIQKRSPVPPDLVHKESLGTGHAKECIQKRSSVPPDLVHKESLGTRDAKECIQKRSPVPCAKGQTKGSLSQRPGAQTFKLPMNRGFAHWCSFKYGEVIYDSRQIVPSPLWVIGSSESEGCGLIVASEDGIEILPYRYGVRWPSQQVS
ncbi:hypothetical protein PCC8801_4558 (plasmid) [Rippkaea orientalis PCC 8801]|uniref:DUF3854 domain-containing protein n=1 Tax=Rippkaea orientalis (strain PCC 8801 / RF-1) TaxID=41431 RepID=B7K6P4_RIPO1|nr:plasmid replication protein, CyRepA1 family [Rippkaea orientalis]ACK68466.1 hypothetical protein PCC8801_4558 [Rippkaea orientalis PCC 8801]